MLKSPLKRIRQGKIYVVGGSADGRTLNTFEAPFLSRWKLRYSGPPNHQKHRDFIGFWWDFIWFYGDLMVVYYDLIPILWDTMGIRGTLYNRIWRETIVTIVG